MFIEFVPELQKSLFLLLALLSGILLLALRSRARAEPVQPASGSHAIRPVPTRQFRLVAGGGSLGIIAAH